jgi:hypothetical protein
MKRISLCSLLVALLAVACHDATDLAGPSEPQFKKGGKPSAPDPKLEEFWVYSITGGCDQMIHIVVSGAFLRIGKNIIHDHFFNGVRDDDPPVETHFEYGFSGPITPPTEFNSDGTVGHADVCFDGVRSVDMDADGNRTLESRFVDYPATSVGGTGADPFAISPGVVTRQTKSITSVRIFRPRGVVVDGDALARDETEVTSSWHGAVFEDVSSYAVYQGEAARGDLFYDGLSIGDVSCSVGTSQIGRGKNKTTVTTTTISANVTVDYGADAEFNQHFWGEGHFRLVTDDTDGLISGRIMTPQTGGTFSASTDFDGDWSGQTVEVEFIADFLQATSGIEEWPGHYSEIYDFVYNPGRNSVSVLTTAGIGGDVWSVGNVSTTLDDGLFPVVYSGSVTVECG